SLARPCAILLPPPASLYARPLHGRLPAASDRVRVPAELLLPQPRPAAAIRPVATRRVAILLASTRREVIHPVGIRLALPPSAPQEVFLLNRLVAVPASPGASRWRR